MSKPNALHRSLVPLALAALLLAGPLVSHAISSPADTVTEATVARIKDVMNVLHTVVDAIATGFSAAADAIKAFWDILQNVGNFAQNNPLASLIGGIGDVVGGTDRFG